MRQPNRRPLGPIFAGQTPTAWGLAEADQLKADILLEVFAPRPDPEFTLATLPPANENRAVTVYVSDGAGDKYRVTSNGTAWFYQEGTAV
tara:strand:- start:684 stop:953 length:270 start_codon:yes stop_codon:yes gene_type:complete